MRLPCLPGKHVWVQRIGFDGSIEEVCANCKKVK